MKLYEFMNIARRHDPMIDELGDMIKEILGAEIEATSETNFVELPDYMWQQIEEISWARFLSSTDDAEAGAESLVSTEIELLGDLLAKAKIPPLGNALPMQTDTRH